MKRKFIIINLILVIVLLVSGITAYAYFNKVFSSNHTLTTDQIVTNDIKVNSLDEFYNAIDLYQESEHNDFNSDDEIRDLNLATKHRKTIVLGIDLNLNANATITIDCHINLNGYTLNLNGYTLNFRNSFAGTISIFDKALPEIPAKANTKGIIKDSTKIEINNDVETIKGKNQIIVDTPNAAFIVDEGLLHESVEVIYEKLSDDAIINSAFNFAYANIANVGVNSLYSTHLSLTSFGDTSKCTIGSHTGTNLLGCVYTHSDLDLIHSFYNYDIDISYKSADATIISDNGRIIDNPITKTKTVNLAISIGYGSKKATPVTKTVVIHIVSEADYAVASNLALQQYLEMYYDPNLKDDAANPDLVTPKYVFSNEFTLPKTNTYFNTTYSYVLFDDQNKQFKDTEKSSYFGTYENNAAVLFKLAAAIKKISITSTVNGTQKPNTIELNVKGKSSGSIDTPYAYCASIVTELYGNFLSVKNITSPKPGEVVQNGYSAYKLLNDPTVKGYSRLKKGSLIEYILEDQENTYKLEPVTSGDPYQLLYVAGEPNILPYLGQDINLTIRFTMEENSEMVNITIPVIYSVNQGANPGLKSFEPFYNYYNGHFIDKTNGNVTYNSFQIPLFYNKMLPTFDFLVYEETTTIGKYNLLTTQQAENLFDIRITREEMPSGEYIKDYINTKNLNDYILDAKSAMYIGIDPYKINFNTTKYHFVYVPIYSDANNIPYYFINVYGKTIEKVTLTELRSNPDIVNLDPKSYEYTSTLTVPGIVRYPKDNTQPHSEAFDSLEFYKYVYKLINNVDFPTDGLTFIESETLLQPIDKIEFIGSDTVHDIKLGNEVIKSLKGIELLKNLKILRLSKMNLLNLVGYKNSAEDWFNQIRYITQITNLEELYLDNTGIYDRLPNSKSGLPTGTSNKLCEELGKLVNLKILDIHNEVENTTNAGNPKNYIYSFMGLGKLKALKKINIKNIKFKANYNFEVVNGLMNGITNGLYGSNGTTNTSVLAILKSKNVEITNDKSETINPNLQKIVDAMPSLEYQDKIRKEDVEKIWENIDKGSSGSSFNLPNDFEVTSGNKTVKYKLINITFTIVHKNEADINSEILGFNMAFNYRIVYRDGLSMADPIDVPFEYFYDLIIIN